MQCIGSSTPGNSLHLAIRSQVGSALPLITGVVSPCFTRLLSCPAKRNGKQAASLSVKVVRHLCGTIKGKGLLTIEWE